MGVVVIGGGFAGVCTVMHLVRAGVRNIQIFSDLPFGQGQAFHGHLRSMLNEPVVEMDFVAEGHYGEWLEAKGYSFGALQNTPRSIFSEYLNYVATGLLETPGVSFHQEHVTSVLPFLENGDDVFLCLGHTSSELSLRMGAEEFALSEERRLAWSSPTALGKIPHDMKAEKEWRTVALIGEGGSAIDALRELESRKYKGKILLVSKPRAFPLWTRTEEQFAAAHGKKNYRLRHFTKQVLNGRPPQRTQILEMLGQEIESAKANGFSTYNVLEALRKWRDHEFFASVAGDLRRLRSNPLRPEDAALLSSRRIKKEVGEAISVDAVFPIQDGMDKPYVQIHIRTGDGKIIVRNVDRAICCAPFAKNMVKPDGTMRHDILEDLRCTGRIQVKDGYLVHENGQIGENVWGFGPLACGPGDPWAVSNFNEFIEKMVQDFVRDQRHAKRTLAAGALVA